MRADLTSPRRVRLLGRRQRALAADRPRRRGDVGDPALVRAASRRCAGAVTSTRHGARRSTYSVTGPISAGREPPIPPSTAPPRIRVGGSAPITIISTPRSRAACDDPAADRAGPDHRQVHLDRVVLLADLLGPLERPVGRVGAVGRRRRVERHGQRQVEHVDHLELGADLARPRRRRRRAGRRCRRCRRRASSRRPGRGCRRTRPSTWSLTSASAGTSTRSVSVVPSTPLR